MDLDFYAIFEKSLLEDKLPHAFLIETNNINLTNTNIIKFLNKHKLIKTNDHFNENLKVIEPDGKNIKLSEIALLQEAFSTIPVNEKYNIYLIKYTEKLNKVAANKLLKFLEEPTTSIVGILLTESSIEVIETIRSRCLQFKVIEYEKDANYLAEVDSIILLINSEHSSFNDVIKVKNQLRQFERNELIEIFEKLFKYYDKILNESISSSNYKKVTEIILVTEKMLQRLNMNVNIDLVLDNFFIELRK